MSKQENTFEFSRKLKADLAKNGAKWENLLFAACLEGKGAEVKASHFCKVLRASGFRCGTGPARAAYKAVKDGGDITAMIAAMDVVKSKRKAGKGTDAGTDAGTDNGTDAGTDNGTDAGTDNGTETLVGALTAACSAAKRGHLDVVETWIGKAQSLLAAEKIATKRAIEKMGGVVA